MNRLKKRIKDAPNYIWLSVLATVPLITFSFLQSFRSKKGCLFAIINYIIIHFLVVFLLVAPVVIIGALPFWQPNWVGISILVAIAYVCGVVANYVILQWREKF